jgi:hypothetical protein
MNTMRNLARKIVPYKYKCDQIFLLSVTNIKNIQNKIQILHVQMTILTMY